MIATCVMALAAAGEQSTYSEQNLWCATIPLDRCGKIPPCDVSADGTACEPFTWDSSTTELDVQQAINEAIGEKIAVEKKISLLVTGFATANATVSAEIQGELRDCYNDIGSIEDQLARYEYQAEKIRKSLYKQAKVAKEEAKTDTQPAETQESAEIPAHSVELAHTGGSWVVPTMAIVGTAGLVAAGVAMHRKSPFVKGLIDRVSTSGSVTEDSRAEPIVALPAYGRSDYSSI